MPEPGWNPNSEYGYQMGGTGLFDGATSAFGNINIDKSGLGAARGVAMSGPQDYISHVPQQPVGPRQLDVGRDIAAIDSSKIGAADMQDQPTGDSGGGIGLMGTLGILNLGAGLGSQIYKMVTAEKPRRPRMPIPMPGGNPMR